MGDHDDELVLRNLFQDLHDLHRGIGIQSAGGLVSKEDIRIIDQGAGDGNTLHLSAGELVGLFVDLIAQAYLFQRLHRTLATLCCSNAREGHGKLYVCKHSLMGDQVIGLEHKADGVVSIGVPIAVSKLFGGLSVDDKIAGAVLIQATDDVQQGGFAAAGVTEDRNKFMLPKAQVNPLQGIDGEVADMIVFFDGNKL